MDFFTESLPSLLGAASAAVPLLQSQRHHEREMENALELHREAIRQAAQQHEQSMHQERDLHREAIKIELEQHLEDIRLTIESARRENLRDVWAQKSRRADTLLLMSSLMITGFFGLLVEGIPPIDVWPALLAVYSAALALSFTLLFLCLYISMKYQARMMAFNIYKPHQLYTCGKQHESYESYYDCHCAGVARWATGLFYGGTLVLLVAGALLVYARLSLTYSNTLAAALYIAITVLTFSSLAVASWLVPNRTSVTERTEAQDAEDDARAMDEGKMGEGPAFGSYNLLRTSLGSSRSNGSRIKRRRAPKLFSATRLPPQRSETTVEEATSFKNYLRGLGLSNRTTDAAVSPPATPPLDGGIDLSSHLSQQTRANLAQSMATLPATARTDKEDSSAGGNEMESVV